MDISRVNVEDIFDEPLQKFWVDVFDIRKKGGRVQKPTHIRPYAFIFGTIQNPYRRNEWF